MNALSGTKCIYLNISGFRKVSVCFSILFIYSSDLLETLKKNAFFFKTDQTYKKYLKKITQNGLVSLLIWSSSATLAVLFFSQGIPRVRTQIHQQLPVFGSSFNTDIPPSDIPQ
ncbi:hypothetical protein PNEG_01966 [Pneumocystis murina B123]|uniref:Uncharacterized protein n=1 Tax=Pneumocystis murina (strain B123) TaxID=1069680 RepID=M7NMA2_PNEMU|nr:hypothetical protein PNEG_01966 [Pneumocystis murina B123]EMR09783.1 hypothetical protein PNEG_01966 [Pneumocystis murina B123]